MVKSRKKIRLGMFGLLAAATAVGVAVADPIKAALPGMERIAFEVFRDGDPLGHHKVTFRHDGDDLHVEVDIELEVSFGFITFFRYSHENREVWRDGRLVAIDTRTDDDGTEYWLRGRATDQGLQVEGSSGSFLAPVDIIPTSYWNPATIEQSRLLDTQKGRLIDLEIAPIGKEPVTVAGQPVDAKRFKVSGDLDLYLWYTPEGEWAKTQFDARGAAVVYARQDQPGDLAALGAAFAAE